MTKNDAIEETCTMSDPCARLQVTETKIENLEEWQRTQNGTLKDINRNLADVNRILEDRIDALRNWVMGALLAALISIGAALINVLSNK